MRIKTWKRVLSLVLFAVLVIGIVPAVFAASDSTLESVESAETAIEPSQEEATAENTPSPEPEEPQISPPVQPDTVETESELDSEEQEATDEPHSDDGESLTRAEVNPRARAATGTVSKSTCVTFSEYESPTWYCNRYYTQGSHVYGHYFYASSIAYHAVNGADAYCVEPNTSSINGQTYTSYDADSASSSSFWMLELDSTQREYITKILACGYPEVDYGYTRQQQYAATQVLIWEVCCKTRYANGIRYCSDYSLFSKVNAVLGEGFQKTYDAILDTIDASNGKVPSFAGTSSAKSITLTYNSATDCYEGSVTDSNAVLSYFTFAYTGVTFTKSGNTLKISVPASSASNVKGKTITGSSDLKDLSSCNPSVWENATYQTVLSSGSADNLCAYISLTWEEPEPLTGNLIVTKGVNYGRSAAWTTVLCP